MSAGPRSRIVRSVASRPGRLALLVAVLLGLMLPLAQPSLAREAGDPPPAQKGDTITWTKTVEQAFARAVKDKKPVLICINSRRVDGGKVEPAAKGLREVIYLDPRVVTKSRRFVCVLLTSEGSSGDYGELRLRFGIDGLITSPQHIFAHPDHATGDKPLFRKEYWPYGKDEGGIKALLDMMDKALVGYAGRDGAAAVPEAPEAADPAGQEPGAADAPAAPAAETERKAWIEKLLGIVRTGQDSSRHTALRSLVTNDRDGDCTGPLIALLPEIEDRHDVLKDVIRVLGRSGLFTAAEPIQAYIKHKDDLVRANAIVSLEYIGCPESAAPLMARVKREKVEVIVSHIFRAIGRCGAGDSKARALLIKNTKGSKSEAASFGPIVGLAYFEKDAKAARAVEKLLKQMGPPGGGRRGGGRGTMKRGMLAWALSEIEDPKSEKFMREKMLEPLSKIEAWWMDAVVSYYDAVARKCGGEAGAKDAVDTGVRRTLQFTGGTSQFIDEARKDRDHSTFEPKADWEIEGRSWGGGRGGGGRGGKGG